MAGSPNGRRCGDRLRLAVMRRRAPVDHDPAILVVVVGADPVQARVSNLALGLRELDEGGS